MKKLFLSAALLLVCCSLCLGCNNKNIGGNKSVVIIKTLRPNQGDFEFERSCDYTVDANYYPDIDAIVCELFNIGTANVYVVDTSGDVVDKQTVYTDNPTEVVVSTKLCNAAFYLVVESDFVYAEGYLN